MTAAPPTTLSFNEAAAFTALGNFILGITPLSMPQITKGLQNRVAEPANTDYAVMTPLRRARLATNITEYYDNKFTGSIAADVLTVTMVEQSEGAGLQPGMLLIDTVWPTMNIQPNTVIVEQLSGPDGGTGTYQVSVSQTLAAETLYAGQRADMVPTEVTIQIDVHGPNSGDNSTIIEGLFRSEVGVVTMGGGSDWQIVPLWIDEAHQVPFVNAESQWEERWTMDARMQINPIIGTPQQFADQVVTTLIEVDEAYPPG